jgi:hypothetical protein
MSNLPVTPAIGEKRPREDDHDDEIGNAVPPHLRGGNNQGNQGPGGRQQMGGGQQQWQGGAGNATNQNITSLDAVYLAELNWVISLLYILLLGFQTFPH